jgi:hypothetical protein
VRPLDRLAPEDQRRVLALTETELELGKQRSPVPTTEIDALLAEEPTGRATRDWLARAWVLIAAFVGQPVGDIERDLGVLAYDYPDDAHEVDAARAALVHLADWAGLDQSQREAALEQELLDSFRRDLETIFRAAEAHGFPVAASDLVLPAHWTFAWADHHLEVLGTLGFVEDSGERNPHGWPIYVDPATPDGSG